MKTIIKLHVIAEDAMCHRKGSAGKGDQVWKVKRGHAVLYKAVKKGLLRRP